jgi:hypothetical protein
VLNATRVLPGSGVRHVQSLGLLGFTETLHLMLSQSLGDCSPISGINPQGQQAQILRLLNRRSSVSDVLTPPSFSGCERADSDL